MKKLITLIALAPMILLAQTTHMVQVVGSIGVTPAYVPANITIDLGDIVRWECSQGTHNVYAEQDSFPNNPEGFNSNPTAQASPWDYEFTFTVAGFYNYGCNGGTIQNPHWDTQQGTVTVLDPSSVREDEIWGRIEVFPVPTRQELTVRFDRNRPEQLEILGLDGRTIAREAAVQGSAQQLDLNGMPAGSYLLRCTDANGRVAIRSFVKVD
ncbi:MAG: T9SS type A sorting domain-containing protein [Flavobacteriales bacterium]|nr:T9SS type A sorting domain-containing protein [Flavobacteriales bacterium]